MTIYLVRHTEYLNPTNIFPFLLPVCLSEAGREHAKRIGAWFAKEVNKDLPIYTSPLVRTVQTAELIASFTGSFVSVDERLIETSCPNLQGKSQLIEKPWVVEVEDATRESEESVTKRITESFNEKIKEGKECIMVSHGDALTFLYYHLMKQSHVQYLWAPENSDKIVRRGEIMKVEIENNEVTSVNKIMV